MSITLKNITPADTISSMVDKINFNFDQVLLNGGGIEGPKGERGYPGMQGVLGRQGEKGDTGESGIRGTLWLKLPASRIETALQDGFTNQDIIDMGENVMIGDIVVSTITNTDSGDQNGEETVSKLYKVIEDISSESRLKPKFFSNFIPNQYFEEYTISGTSNSLVRTSSSGSGNRGLVLNDYNGHISLSSTLINSIINNNAAIVYTEANSQENSEGSPNSGIVFIKNGDTSQDDLGYYPRINYIKYNNIDQLNIHASNQSINISAGQDINANSECFNCRINSNFEVFYKESENSEKFTYIKTEKDSNDNHNLYLSADNFKLCKIVDNISADLLTFDTAENDVCKIQVHKGYVNLHAGYSFYITNSYTTSSQSSPKLIEIKGGSITIKPHQTGDMVKIGKWEDYDSTSSTDPSYGLMTGNKETIIASANSGHHRSEIILSNSNDNFGNIKIKTKDYSSTLITNISEEFNAALININSTGLADPYSTIKFTTYAVWGTRSEHNSIFAYYGRYNAYDDLRVISLLQPQSFFAGSSVFTGRGVTGTVANNNKITYSYIKVGNIVHCEFHGIVSPYYLTAAKTSNNRSINKKTVAGCYESYYYSSSQTRDRNWQTGATNKNSSLLIDIYPPVMEITRHSTETSQGTTYSYHTNIKNLTGSLVFSHDNSITNYALYYGSDTIVPFSSGNSVYIIPSLQAKEYKGSGQQQIVVNPSMPISVPGTLINSTSSISDYYTLIMNGSPDSSARNSQAEICGSFSYTINVEEMHHHCKRTDTDYRPASN